MKALTRAAQQGGNPLPAPSLCSASVSNRSISAATAGLRRPVSQARATAGRSRVAATYHDSPGCSVPACTASSTAVAAAESFGTPTASRRSCAVIVSRYWRSAWFFASPIRRRLLPSGRAAMRAWARSNCAEERANIPSRPRKRPSCLGSASIGTPRRRSTPRLGPARPTAPGPRAGRGRRDRDNATPRIWPAVPAHRRRQPRRYRRGRARARDCRARGGRHGLGSAISGAATPPAADALVRLSSAAGVAAGARVFPRLSRRLTLSRFLAGRPGE